MSTDTRDEKKRKFRLYSLENSGITVQHRTQYGKNSLHFHDYYAIDMIAAGKAEMVLNSDKFTVERGDVVFLTPADYHAYATIHADEGQLKIYLVKFVADTADSDLLADIIRKGKRHFKLDGEKLESLEKILGAMNKLQEADKGVQSILTHLLNAVLMLIICEDNRGEFSSGDGGVNIQKAIGYIHENFKENPPLSEVASVIPLNERYFCQKFKECMGVTYKEYLKGLKLRYARRLVTVTDYPITDIAEKSGYTSQGHFNREFKKLYGISPMEMRKKKSNQKN